jgi:hypothetical protein
MAPSRPLVHPEQIGLVLLTALAIGLGLLVAVRVLF